MSRAGAQVVWFKRDLRIADHAPLARAAECGAVLPLYVYEPALISAADTAAQHIAFANECLAELAAALAQLGSPLVTRQGEMTAVLDELHRTLGIATLWSHQETGNHLTYMRDRAVAVWCRERSIPWIELAQHGVVRRLATRNRWARQWDARMREPISPTPSALRAPASPIHTIGLPGASPLGLRGADKPERQRGGRSIALQRLDSFLAHRAQHYRHGMSSPVSGETACSRVSADLAYGTLSLREVAQALAARRTALLDEPADARPPGFLASLKSFEGRLHWHCHFMQKLESEPAIEFRNVHRGFDGLREDAFNRARFNAWAMGETGLPMVDACMRMLAATGWINFRMRAMLVSFSSYQLWNHWREPALHLAREFLDYEAGIHYPQVQMQSGVTGINTVRIYNPVKQARDQDPSGEFVRRWIPALAGVPTEYIFEPWTMSAAAQSRAGCMIGRDYPAPVVDHEQAARTARERIWARRRDPIVKREAAAVYEKHGSRSPSLDGVRKRRAPTRTPQADLFE
jgi:deoxyribodipyrimidine photo-lyase